MSRSGTGSLLQPFTDSFIKALLTERFKQVIYRVIFEGFNGIFVKCGSKNYCRWLFHQFQHFEPVDLWHLNIQENKIGLLLQNGLNPFKAIITFLHQVNLCKGLQVFFYNRSCQWFIIYNNCLDHACGIFMVVVNRLFSLWVVSRSFLANSRYKRRCAELSPKPVPCLGDEVSGSNGFFTEMI